jgi:hypothetical protein
MTGICKLCQQLVIGPPVPELGEDRAKAEFVAFADEMRKHIGALHPKEVQMYAAILTMAAGFFSCLFADCETEDFTVGQQAMREVLTAAIQTAQLVVSSGSPVPRPLVLPT